MNFLQWRISSSGGFLVVVNFCSGTDGLTVVVYFACGSSRFLTVVDFCSRSGGITLVVDFGSGSG